MNRRLPLKGIRVIDLSHSWAAPHCARLLGDYGAEVIKVEYARRLCLLRGARKKDKIFNRHAGWIQVNRNKLSITLDLTREKDCDTLSDLVKISDVVIENSRPGVMGKFGFDYSDLVKLKPDLIVLSMAAFGNSGPFSAYVGYGATFEVLGGIQSLTAYQRGGTPMRIREMDVSNGLAGACAVMTALLHRQKTGEGQYIDLSQLEAATHATIGEHLLEKAINAVQTLPTGNRHWKYAPQGCYRCKGDDKWIAITVRSDGEWRAFCEVIDNHDWISDPRFATNEARQANHDELDREIEAWTVAFAPDEVMHRLQKAGVPSGAVLTVADLSENSHLKQRAYFLSGVSDSSASMMGLPIRFFKGSGELHRRGPELGQDNEYVLCGLLKRSKDEVDTVPEEEIGMAFDSE